MPKARIPKIMPQHIHKERDGMSASHLRDIGGCPCILCGATDGTVVPHHALSMGDRGTGMRAADKHAMPLCFTCHTKMKNAAAELQAFAERCIDLRGFLSAFWGVRGSVEAMCRVVLNTRSRAALR